MIGTGCVCALADRIAHRDMIRASLAPRIVVRISFPNAAEEREAKGLDSARMLREAAHRLFSGAAGTVNDC
jgi:hypothetical protein